MTAMKRSQEMAVSVSTLDVRHVTIGTKGKATVKHFAHLLCTMAVTQSFHRCLSSLHPSLSLCAS